MYKITILLTVLVFSYNSYAQKMQKKSIAIPVKKTAIIQSMPILKDDPNPVRYFSFKKDSSVYKPKYFYIKNVIDSTFKDSIGYVIQPKSGKKQPANFKNGLQTSLIDFYSLAVQKDSTLMPIEVVIKQIDLSEEKIDLYSQGLFEYKYSFNYKDSKKYIYLNEAKGSYNYKQPLPFPNKRIDSVFAEVFLTHLSDLDNEVNDVNNNHTYFCKGVDVNATSIQSVAMDSDTLYSSKDSRLDITSFMGDASGADDYFKTYIGLHMTPTFNYEKGRMQINVQTGAYFVKSQSWIGSKVKKAWIVNNSNYKLKLAWLESERLRKKIVTYKFSCTEYIEELKQLVNFSLKQLNYTYNEYEKQTLNGANKSEQQRWETFIDNKITEFENNK